MSESELLEAPRAPLRAVNPTTTLTEADLEAGDVLLARGIGDVSDAIVQLDGGDYSHAAFWDGGDVVEAVQDGVHRSTLGALLSHRRYTDAYRFRKGGHALGDAGWPADPVVEAVRRYVGGDYAAAELLLMGLLIATGKRVTHPLAKLAIFLLGPAAKKLQDWLDARARQGKRSLVCTQVVTSGYYEAGQAHRYALEVDVAERFRAAAVGAAPLLASPLSEPAAGEAGLPEEFEALRASCARLVVEALPGVGAADVVRAADPMAAGGAAATLGAAPGGEGTMTAGSALLPIVTPRELQRSPTLALVGRLAQP